VSLPIGIGTPLRSRPVTWIWSAPGSARHSSRVFLQDLSVRDEDFGAIERQVERGAV
jgi:hypothetical protein